MNNPKVAVENLAIELTRRCNLKCAHCMLGGCENKEISDETLDRIFEEVSTVGLLNFIGGESSLAVDRINKLVEIVKKHNALIHCVLVFTNAVNVTDEYINALKNLQSIAADDYYDNVGFVSRNEKEGKYPLKIVVSLDKFHLKSIEEQGISKAKVKANIERLAELFPVEIDKLCNYVIYNEGGGVNIKNMYKSPTPNQKYCSVYVNYDKVYLIGPIVAIGYDGKIVEANRSHVYRDRFGIGDINTESIMSMFEKLKKEKGIKLCKDIESAYECMDKYLHVYSSTTKEIKNMVKYYQNKKQKMDYSYFEQDVPTMFELQEDVSEEEMEK